MRLLAPLTALVVSLVIPAPSSAGPGEKAHLAVPRTVQVSVGRDHVWASVRATRTPAMVGEESWAKWDRDGSGLLEEPEFRALSAWVADREITHLCVSVDGEVLPFPKFPVRYAGDQLVPLPLDAPVDVRIEGRRNMKLALGPHRYVLYDVPPDVDGFVPFRLTMVNGFRLGDAQGTRGEKRGDRRLEATMTAFTPAMWGPFERGRPGVLPAGVFMDGPDGPPRIPPRPK